jgi:hypothetical protein
MRVTEKGYSMKQLLFSPMMPVLLALVLPAFAWGAVEVLDSAGAVQQEVWGAPSPTPEYCYWEKDENAGPDFHATNADGHGNSGCTFPWLAHCDGDSLVYHGTWPLIEGLYLLGSDYRATLSCSVNLATETSLTIDRAVSGNLGVDEHVLTVVIPNGDEVLLLAPGTGPDHLTLDFLPGAYQFTISVEATQHGPTGTPVDPYDGWIRLVWEDPGVAVSTTSWSSLKALYR